MNISQGAHGAHRLRVVLIGASACLLAAAANAQVTAWDEAVDGDLSGDPDAPTPITLEPGVNILSGRMQDPADTRDYINFTIPEGQQLVAVLLQQYEDVDSGGPGDRGFVAVNEGLTSVIPGFDTPVDFFLGGAHLDPDPAGTDYLAILGTAPQTGAGFTPPLGPGDYTWLTQQTGPELTAYSFEFVVEALAEDIAGTTTDVTTLRVICRNIPLGQTVNLPGMGMDWNCSDGGLMADAGDLVLQIVVGRATCGADPCDIGGTTSGVTATTTLCRNITTGAAVNVSAAGNVWNCTDGGLGADNGNIILQVIRGTAD